MSYSKDADPMSMMVLNLTQAVPTSCPADPFFSVETRRDREMWNFTKATFTRKESLRSSELKIINRKTFKNLINSFQLEHQCAILIFIIICFGCIQFEN